MDTASHAAYTIPITSAESQTSYSDEMAGDSLKDPATTRTAFGINRNGGTENGSP